MDKNAVKAHTLVATANKIAKYKSQHLAYTYTFSK